MRSPPKAMENQDAGIDITKNMAEIVDEVQAANEIFMPIIIMPSNPTLRVNVPYFENDFNAQEMAIFWFGYVNMRDNYTDVRIGYNDQYLYIRTGTFDRLLYNDETPSVDDLTSWDAVSLYLDLDGNQGGTPDSNSFRFVAQLSIKPDQDDWRAAYRGNGFGWILAPVDVETKSVVWGKGPNTGLDSRGWSMTFRIPFESLGLQDPPVQGTIWGMAFALHDRDDFGGTPIADKFWPDNIQPESPTSWGQISFGWPQASQPPSQAGTTVMIRHGFNNVTVVDGHVGGDTTCGHDYAPGYFDGWGDANYYGDKQVNIMNQWEVHDWPCFSKFFVTFPLDTLPTGRTILSATAQLHMFSNAGIGTPNPPGPSLIQVLVVGEDWLESSLTWNNAPLAADNISRTRVYPIGDGPPPPPGTPYDWDVTQAVAEAYAAGEPLRVVFYSADTAQNSGKYFHSSNAGLSLEEGRPTLFVTMGD
jgi:hypothetical protein